LDFSLDREGNPFLMFPYTDPILLPQSRVEKGVAWMAPHVRSSLSLARGVPVSELGDSYSHGRATAIFAFLSSQFRNMFLIL
jgi:hypothetical protein